MTPVTVNDVNQYITMIRINFENSYKTQTKEEMKLLIKSWFAILKDYPKEVCDVAVINAIKNAEFAPRIGTIVKEIEKMQLALEKSDGELWMELTNVLPEVAHFAGKVRYTYIPAGSTLTQGEMARNRIEAIYNSLSPELKQYCGNANGLIDVAYMTNSQLNYEKTRFERVMPQIKARTKTRAQMPNNITGLIQGLTVHLIEEKTAK